MAVIRWNPWNLSSVFEDGVDFPTIPGLSRLSQGLNLYETEDMVVAEAALPGIEDSQVDVTIDDGIVRVSALAEDKVSDKSQRGYYMKSMATSFNYSFRLPEGVLENQEPKAELHNGILTLTFSKVAKTPPKKVKVVTKKKGEEKII